MNVPFTLPEVTGGLANVLDAWLASRPKPGMSIDVALMQLREKAKVIGTDAIFKYVYDEIDTAYHQYIWTTGENYEDADVKDDWTDGLDAALEDYLMKSGLARCVSSSWMATNCIDSRLYVTPEQGPDETTKAAKSFAVDAWSILTFNPHRESNRDAYVEYTAEELLTEIGITRADVAQLLGQVADNPPVTTPTEIKPVSTLAMALAKAAKFGAAAYTDEKLTAAFAQILEDDEDFQRNGCATIGCGIEDAEPFQMFAMGEADPVPALIANLRATDVPAAGSLVLVGGDMNAPGMAAALAQDAAKLQALTGEIIDHDPLGIGQGVQTDEEAELNAMMGFGAPVVAPAPAELPAGHVPAAVLGAGPEPRTRAPRGAAAAAAGAIPADAFKLMREHVKRKDEDMGTLIGVSRQTYINYTTGKATFVPDAAQRETLVNLLDAEIGALRDARAMIDGMEG